MRVLTVFSGIRTISATSLTDFSAALRSFRGSRDDGQDSDPDEQSSDPAHVRLLGALPLLRYHRLRYDERNATFTARFRSEIDLIGASQMRRFAPKRTHALEYDTRR